MNRRTLRQDRVFKFYNHILTSEEALQEVTNLLFSEGWSRVNSWTTGGNAGINWTRIDGYKGEDNPNYVYYKAA